jgi:hypothetical protein
MPVAPVNYRVRINITMGHIVMGPYCALAGCNASKGGRTHARKSPQNDLLIRLRSARFPDLPNSKPATAPLNLQEPAAAPRVADRIADKL